MGLQDSDGQGGFKYSPYAISGRPLVAKSCTGCGTLRDAAAYLLSGKSWRGKCAYCLTEWRTDYYSKLPDIAKAKAWEAAKGIAHTKQSESLLRAENRGKQYTSADLEILASPSLTYAEKAEATGRSVSGIKSVCAKNGFVSRFSPIKNRSFPRWGIDKPGA
ncbi:hypothetical protein BLJ79_21430 [Arthrobacter sp. UCD-GKA]|nr:hypothetical protein BLJ79_21430 [Arthrobacter sp. UCD-GKA]